MLGFIHCSFLATDPNGQACGKHEAGACNLLSGARAFLYVFGGRRRDRDGGRGDENRRGGRKRLNGGRWFDSWEPNQRGAGAADGFHAGLFELLSQSVGFFLA